MFSYIVTVFHFSLSTNFQNALQDNYFDVMIYRLIWTYRLPCDTFDDNE